LGINAVITLDASANNGTVSSTSLTRNYSAVPVPHDKTDTGVGTITTVNPQAGVLPQLVVTTGVFTRTGHGFSTGQSIQITTNGVNIPAPLALLTTYWVIWLSASTFALATTRDHAIAGIGISFTTAGDEGKTLTLTSQVDTGSLLIQYCLDITVPVADSVWTSLFIIDLVASTSPQTNLVLANPYMWIRGVLDVTNGALTSVNLQMTGKV